MSLRLDKLEGHKKIEYFGVALGWAILALGMGYAINLAA